MRTDPRGGGYVFQWPAFLRDRRRPPSGCASRSARGRKEGRKERKKGSRGEIPVDPRELNYGSTREGVFVRPPRGNVGRFRIPGNLTGRARRGRRRIIWRDKRASFVLSPPISSETSLLFFTAWSRLERRAVTLYTVPADTRRRRGEEGNKGFTIYILSTGVPRARALARIVSFRMTYNARFSYPSRRAFLPLSLNPEEKQSRDSTKYHEDERHDGFSAGARPTRYSARVTFRTRK